VTTRVAWSAPGRINLIGEHTDYNDGFVLPFALAQRTTVAASPTGDPLWTVESTAAKERVAFGPEGLTPGAVPGWAGYIAGVVWVLREAGVDVPGARLAITSDVPLGAGLSSSAALECATLAALLDLAGDGLPMPHWPALAQRAENAYVGVPCGIMDQSAATLCQDGHALFLDCRSLATEQVPFRLADHGLALLVLDTRVRHRHADSEYAVRRRTCEDAADALGLSALRDATIADVAKLTDDVQRRRARHVVTENERVLATIEQLRAGRADAIGPLLTASHESLRDDFEVSAPELDAAVNAALAAGALGARMTGGGFGGCVIALVPVGESDRIAAAVTQAFRDRSYADPVPFLAAPGPGVARLPGGA
jgi:galactokinase